MAELQFQFLSDVIAMAIPLLFVALMLDDPKSRRIILYFCWGTVAGLISFNIDNHLGITWEQAQRMSISIAPIVEELCKCLPLLLFFNKKLFPDITKQIVFCGMASGVGFSIVESMYYFAASPQGISDVGTLVARTLTTSLMHGMTTAAFGLGLLLLYKQKHLIIPLVLGLLSLCVSIHALFNLMLQASLVPVAVIMPIIMFLAVWVSIRRLGTPEQDIGTPEQDVDRPPDSP